MLIRLLIILVVTAFSVGSLAGQVPAGRTENTIASPSPPRSEKLRDIPFPAGVDLQFLIKELARDMDLNVLFDVESFRGPRKTFIELRNVTAAAAIDYILLQEGLYFEEAGPRTILVANLAKRSSVPQIGISVLPLTEQLAQYFGVQRGILINWVRDNSPASKAGLQAGDVIIDIDGVSASSALGLVRVINDKKEGEVILNIVRERKGQTISVTPALGIKSVL